MRRAAKIDANQHEIVQALKQVGWKVKSAASLGRGFPDLVIARGHSVQLVEVKRLKGSLTADQQRFIIRDGWPVRIIRTVEEALEL